MLAIFISIVVLFSGKHASTAIDTSTDTTNTDGPSVPQNTNNPIIELNGPDKIIVEASKDAVFKDTYGATCNDAMQGAINMTRHHRHRRDHSEFSESGINLAVIGDFIIQYRCTNLMGMTVTKEREVIIRDTLPPVITLQGDSYTCTDTFDETPTETKSCDHSEMDCGQCTYRCTDSSQNTANKTTTVECPDPIPAPTPVSNATTPDPICCMAMTASCLACSAGQTVQEYCRLHPETQGCPLPPEERLCCRAMTADCLSCNLDISIEEYCRLRPDTVGCPLLGCPQDCSRYFDGCNKCRCSDGLARCTKMFCAEPTAFVCHDDQPDEPEHNCRTRERWTVEKREWCCVNERVGCCPQVRCRLPPDNCNRTWSREVNERGCLVYPCGIHRCAARPRINPGIILRDDRGVERMRTNANSTFETFENEGLDTARINEDGRVTFRVIDDRGRPRVEMACRAGENACLNMSTPEDIVRRRNIIKEVVDTLGPVIMSVDESGLSSLRISRADSVVIQPVNDKPVNTTNCADADVDVQTFAEDAYEIVLREKNEQFMACSDKKLLALVTLQNINPDGPSEYSVECWRPKKYKWEFVELLREGNTFACPELSDYTFEIASVVGLTYALTVPPTPQAEPPAPAPPPLTVVYGPGVTKIEACIEDEITIVWNGTHDLRETETADCDSNETETSPWHSEETSGYNKTFIGLGGRYQGETRYYMCSQQCDVNNARLEVTCQYAIDPSRRVMVNVAESNLEIPALIVAGAIIAIIAAALSAVFCKRKRAANKSKRVTVKNITVTSKAVDELEKRLLEKPLNWVP